MRFRPFPLLSVVIIGSLFLLEPSAEAQKQKRKRVRSKSPSSTQVHYPRFSYDFGVAAGSANSSSFFELSVGLNTFFTNWFIWRNAAFYRLGDADQSFAGLDTSARLRRLTPVSEDGLINFYIGTGYRFVTKGSNVPFVESGLGYYGPSVSLGLGLKMLLNSMVVDGAENTLIFSLLLSGGGGL